MELKCYGFYGLRIIKVEANEAILKTWKRKAHAFALARMDVLKLRHDVDHLVYFWKDKSGASVWRDPVGFTDAQYQEHVKNLKPVSIGVIHRPLKNSIK